MTIAKLKAKNQLTIPKDIVKRLHLRPYEMFLVDVKKNYIRLIPMELKPRYTAKELTTIDQIVKREKGRAKKIKPGKEFSAYIKKIAA